MLNHIYELIGTGIAHLRNGEPAAGDCAVQLFVLAHLQSCLSITFLLGDFIDSVKVAAEGVKSHSSSVASWMRSSVSPTLSNMLATFPGSPPGQRQPQPSTSAAGVWAETPLAERNCLNETFAAPSTTLEWKTKSEWSRNERHVMGSKVCRRQVCMSPAHRKVAKVNGHSVTVPPSITPKLHPSPRLGRPLHLRPNATQRYLLYHFYSGVANSSCPSMYEKIFPIKVVQSPTHSNSSGQMHNAKPRCTAQQSVCEDEKEVYRQLLAMVSGGQSSSLHNGSSHAIVRSHRDFTSFLTTSRRLLQLSSPTGSAVGGTSEGPSSPTGTSSQCLSNLPSPAWNSSRPEIQAWSQDTGSSRAATLTAAPSPSALMDNSSQDTQSSAHDGDSVIIISEQKGKNEGRSSVPCFQAELWIKELTSMYDSRARERRRQIDEQVALASQLLQQRLSEKSQLSPDVEVHVRVPLEKEVPLTLVIEEQKALKEKPEFPELTEVWHCFNECAVYCVKMLNLLFHLFVINFYMNLLVERSKDPSLPSVNTFNTFFYPKLRSSGYSAVRRWTKKMDIFSKDILLVPVHLGVHWCLSVVDFRKKAVIYFDSLGGNNDEACRILFEYLQQESKDKKGKVMDTTGWSLHSKKRNQIPQQMNGSDCGMFTCKYADYFTKDKPITFTQNHMPYFRRRMVWEILHHKLL
uniref:SUMO specific peptidase 1 n=1 Tax=Gasterosteus aculeatus aculeatus TaxID=481459 RepID=A0AAQ4QFD6_GASAC